MSEFTVAQNGCFAEVLHWNLIENFAGRSERLDKDGLLGAHYVRNEVEIRDRQSQIFGKRAVMVHDSENLTTGAVSRETTFAIGADGAKAQGSAGDIDFTHDAFAQPSFLFVRANTCNVLHFSDKFMPRSAAKIVVAAQDFDVGVADAGKTNADKRPAAPQIGNGLAGSEELVVADDEGEQGNLLFGFFRKCAPRGRRHSLEQFKLCL